MWVSIGSDNLCRRSWTHDSELSAAVMDENPPGPSAYARRLLAAAAYQWLHDPDGLPRAMHRPGDF